MSPEIWEENLKGLYSFLAILLTILVLCIQTYTMTFMYKLLLFPIFNFVLRPIHMFVILYFIKCIVLIEKEHKEKKSISKLIYSDIARILGCFIQLGVAWIIAKIIY